MVRTANVLERHSDRFPSTKFQVAAEFMGTPGIEFEHLNSLNPFTRERIPELGRNVFVGLTKKW